MGTHIKLKRTTYSNVGRVVRKYGTIPIATASLGVSSANLATNVKRNKKEGAYRKEQLKATKDLTNSLINVDKSLKEKTKELQEEPKKSKIIRFLPFNNNNN